MVKPSSWAKKVALIIHPLLIFILDCLMASSDLKMRQMENEAITIEETLKANAAKVWEAITDKEQMKEWYFDIAEFRPVEGFEFQFYGDGQDGEKFLHLCKVIEVVPGEKITYSWRYHGFEGNSYVTFELTPAGTETILKLTHSDLESFGENPAFARANFVAGWNYIIPFSLKKFVESSNA